jgi:hypothetical protein
LRTNEKDPVLLALQSEAFVEVNVVGRCRDACLALEQGNPSAAIQTLDRIPADHSHLVKPLRDLACSRIDRHNGARTPAADYNWESAKQNRSLDFIGRE